MASLLRDPKGNSILAALINAGQRNILAHLSAVSLSRGQVLSTPSAPMDRAYFITSGMACTITSMRNGATVAGNLIGQEGFVGLPLLFAHDTFPTASTVMQLAGTAMRISASVFQQEISRPGTLQAIMRRYALAQMAEVMQMAACNRLHSIEERLACWLLMTSDRVGPDFRITHEMSAQLLGCRRATVTAQAERFQSMGLITYRYGQVHITSRARLERAACECYEVHRHEREKVLKF